MEALEKQAKSIQQELITLSQNIEGGIYKPKFKYSWKLEEILALNAINFNIDSRNFYFLRKSIQNQIKSLLQNKDLLNFIGIDKAKLEVLEAILKITSKKDLKALLDKLSK